MWVGDQDILMCPSLGPSRALEGEAPLADPQQLSTDLPQWHNISKIVLLACSSPEPPKVRASRFEQFGCWTSEKRT